MDEGVPSPAHEPGLPAHGSQTQDVAQVRANDRYEQLLEKMKFVREVDYDPKPLEPMPVKYEYRNVDQTRIEVTEDKLRNIIGGQLDRRDIRIKWVAAATLLLAVLAALVTSDFREYGSLTASTWKGIFGAAALFAAAFVVRYGVAAVTAPTRDELVEDMIGQIRGDRSLRPRGPRWRRSR